MRYGYWMPVFGGWLRNVEDEHMEATWEYVNSLASRSEEIGFDLSLIAELNLNDIKGDHAPALDAWSTAAALAAVTKQPRVDGSRQTYLSLPRLAGQTGGQHRSYRGPGRLSLNVVSSWRADEATKGSVSNSMTTVMPVRPNG